MDIKKHIWYWAGGGYGADVNAYVVKLNADGVTKPSGTVLSAMDVMMKALRAAFPTELETINIYGFGSLEAGKYNLVDVETYEHTFPSGNPTFEEGQGVKSDLTTYINTQYGVNEFPGIETLLSTGIYISESSTVADSSSVIGARGLLSTGNSGVGLQPLIAATTGSRGNYAAPDNFLNSNHKGLYIMTFNGTHVVIYKDYDGQGGGIKDLQAVTPSAPDLGIKVYFLARNNNASNVPALHYPNFAVLLFRIRKQLTDIDAIIIKNIWDIFRGSTGLIWLANSVNILANSTNQFCNSM